MKKPLLKKINGQFYSLNSTISSDLSAAVSGASFQRLAASDDAANICVDPSIPPAFAGFVNQSILNSSAVIH